MAFLGIKVPHEICRLFRDFELPGKQESESEYHITILCFDDGLPIKDISKAMEAAFAVTEDFKPFVVSTKKIDCFPPAPNGMYPVISKITSPELQALNKKLRKSFDKHGVEYNKRFKDYKPHITLAWSEEDMKPFSFDEISFAVNEIVLWGGDHGDDRLFITFPLKSPGKKKTSFLHQKAEVFEKLSNNKYYKF